MIAEWNGRRPVPPGVRDAGPAWAERFDGSDSGLAAVAVCLARVGTVEAIETLRKDLGGTFAAGMRRAGWMDGTDGVRTTSLTFDRLRRLQASRDRISRSGP